MPRVFNGNPAMTELGAKLKEFSARRTHHGSGAAVSKQKKARRSRVAQSPSEATFHWPRQYSDVSARATGKDLTVCSSPPNQLKRMAHRSPHHAPDMPRPPVLYFA